MSEKLSLQWNDFLDNIKSAFGSFREDNDFADVTLACEDGQQVEAHKVILAASSPFFQRLLGRNKHSHPLIYMRGVKSEDLLAIVDFVYRGEASVCQENLDSFLSIAEELQLNGLTGKSDEKVEDFNVDEKSLPLTPQNVFERQMSSSKIQCPEENRSLAIPDNLEELDQRVMSMMEKSQNSRKSKNRHEKAYICRVCGKEDERSNMKNHIEANHLEGIIIPCNLCDKTFRSRNALRLHRYKNHPALAH